MTAASPYRIAAGRKVAGTLWVPSSKSVTHRYLNLALLARSPLVVERPLLAQDTRLSLAALERCGFDVEVGEERVSLTPGPEPAGGEIHCGNAGTLFRFVTASLCTLPGTWRIDGTPRLRQRPIAALVEALRRLGAEIRYLGVEGLAPLEVRGGVLPGGSTRLDAGASSQYLSALLMAALAAREEVEIEVEALTSEPYVEITLAAVAAFGGRVERLAPGRFRVRPGLAAPDRLEVEGDYSAACYPAAAAAVTGGRVRLRGLRRGSPQGDRRFFDLLRRMGAQVEEEMEEGAEGWEVAGGGELRALTADLSGLPDQVPTLAALAPFARGITRIENVPHLRIKESDRLAAMTRELARAGARVEERPDGLVIPGVWAGEAPPGDPVIIDPHDDHRIAMSLALVGLRRPGLAVADPGVVAKSYPGFWHDLETLLA